MITGGNALSELAHVLAFQQVLQLRLTDQDDAQQLVAMRLQVGQQAHLFEHFPAQILGLVDDEHGLPALGVGLQEMGIERVHQRLERSAGAGIVDVQLIANRRHELFHGQFGIEAERYIHILQLLCQQGPDQGGFAGAHLAGQLHEAAAFPRTVQQMRQGFPMVGAHEKVAGVRCNGERVVPKTEIGHVHGITGVGALALPRQFMGGWRITMLPVVAKPLPGFRQGLRFLIDQFRHPLEALEGRWHVRG